MRWIVEVEVNSTGSQADVEDWFATTLTACEFYPQNLKVRPARVEPPRLGDFPARAVRRSTGSETYRVVIPGLLKEDQEVTVPVWEEGVDPELLAHILDNEGTW